MSLIEIQASFKSEQEAQEALHKLQALRAIEVGGYQEGGGILTATVDEAIAERAMHLTRQLLGFGRQRIVARQVVSLNTVVEGMERMLRPLLGEDIALVTSLAPGLEGIEADYGQMEQVMVHVNLPLPVPLEILHHRPDIVDAAFPNCAAGQQVRHGLIEIMGKPFPPRRRKPHLVRPCPNRFGDAPPHGLAQDEFIPGTPYLPFRWEAEQQRHKPKIEERQPSFHRMRHRIPVFDSEIQRERKFRDGSL